VRLRTQRRPDAVYVVLGATHPNLVRRDGEVYRESLKARTRELGIEDHVVFLNQFVDQATLVDFISMCDVYATPYLNEAQMTSCTLAYSFGVGKAVVSTPYWHARELLAQGRGVLVQFGELTARFAAFIQHSWNPVPRLSISSLSRQPLPSPPVSLRGARTAISSGEPMPSKPSSGFSAAPIYPLCWRSIDVSGYQAHVTPRSHEPLVRPEPSNREGYIPNVVYTCGRMRHGERVILPYAVSDTYCSVGTMKIAALIDNLRGES